MNKRMTLLRVRQTWLAFHGSPVMTALGYRDCDTIAGWIGVNGIELVETDADMVASL